MMNRRISLYSLIAFISAMFVSACSSDWQVRALPSELAIETALDNDPDLNLLHGLELQELPLLQMPEAVRPCCAFGNAQKVKIGSVQVPFFRYANTLAVDNVGPHAYEAGAFSFQKGAPDGRRGTENNGQMYTLRGGFIDLAHVRDTADNAIALFYRIYPKLGQEQVIALPEEIGPRTIKLSEFDSSQLNGRQRWEVAAAMAVRLAYFMAEAHEIAQWHGYRSWAPWSETVSAYSPEDLYSNMLGAKIALALLNNNLAMSTELYNQHMSQWLAASLHWLMPVTIEQTNALFDVVDGHWWDSKQALPNKFMLLKRHYELGDKQSPFLVPETLAQSHIKWTEVEALYQQTHQAHHLSISRTIHGIDIDAVAEQKLVVADKFKDSFKHIPIELWRSGFTQVDFYQISQYNQEQDNLELQQHQQTTDMAKSQEK
ncbi:DUF4056 domain-containing protein [Shewanella sp. D64]|uniref:DUF4056 domain-containing protein n=1 Tax=unclassified Shewanella TaxID=196818 RepID=UPI0022BA16F0|nr:MULTISPECIES: DUF4056 domain-containing protein [unclassified Shewanella]MEC4727424.1 DUF4056 domain-containing protein [Shewanella sp. D64]MEC4739579.1 DUF4056 domain-containing protein [Shewanella sp. E94]WBJ96038.1 DUF4056 domain-containing protein [Shewanella sp. MTB7]